MFADMITLRCRNPAHNVRSAPGNSATALVPVEMDVPIESDATHPYSEISTTDEEDERDSDDEDHDSDGHDGTEASGEDGMAGSDAEVDSNTKDVAGGREDKTRNNPGLDMDVVVEDVAKNATPSAMDPLRVAPVRLSSLFNSLYPSIDRWRCCPALPYHPYSSLLGHSICSSCIPIAQVPSPSSESHVGIPSGDALPLATRRTRREVNLQKRPRSEPSTSMSCFDADCTKTITTEDEALRCKGPSCETVVSFRLVQTTALSCLRTSMLTQ